jgi:predicted nucleic acid-binding protein
MKRRTTSSAGVYCVDSNVLIDIHRDYPSASFPTLWAELTTLVSEGRLISSAEVLRELGKRVGDPVHGWAKKHKAAFLDLSEDVQQHVVEIMAQFPTMAKERGGYYRADPFVVATAKVGKALVVTHEADDGSTKRPKIPLVCRWSRVPCIRFPEIVTREGWVFR